MPVYNGEKHLAEAIQSILTQTFSDDGSSDDSPAIIRDYAERDNRIQFIPLAENSAIQFSLC